MFRSLRPPRFPLGCLLIAALLVTGPGCQRKGPPSPQYAQAQALFSTVYAEKLEDAYLDPRISDVEDLLRQVPASSIDGDAAQAQLKKISDAKAQAVKAEADRKAAIDDALKPPPAAFSTRTAPAPAAAPPLAEVPDAGVDAGSPHPIAGMSLAEFRARFLDCFDPGPRVAANGSTMRATWLLTNLSRCRDQHPGFDQWVVVEGDGEIMGISPRAAMHQVTLLPDGGLPR